MKNKNTWADINKDESSVAITASEIADTVGGLCDALRWISQFSCEAQLQDNPAFLQAALKSVEMKAEKSCQKHVIAMNKIFKKAHDHQLKAIAEKEVAK